MPDIYISNMSKQKQRFSFRLPEFPPQKVFMEEIPVGGQVKALNRFLSQPEAEALINQLRAYGAIDGREIAKRQGFVGLAYSTAKQFDLDRIAEGVEAGVDARTAQAAEFRTETAVGMHHAAAKALGAADGDTSPVRSSDVTIKEVVGRGKEGGFGEESIQIRRQGEGGEVRRAPKRTVKSVKAA